MWGSDAPGGFAPAADQLPVSFSGPVFPPAVPWRGPEAGSHHNFFSERYHHQIAVRPVVKRIKIVTADLSSDGFIALLFSGDNMRHARPHIQSCPDSFLNMATLGFALLILLIPIVSADGNWVQMTADAGWPARGFFSSVAMPDGSIVLMGGFDGHVLYNDVWRSTDSGATWTQMSPKAGWTARYFHGSVAMPDGSIVLIGGEDGTPQTDVWRSTDYGATWTRIAADAGWAPREHLSTILMPDGSIIVSGGTLPSGTTMFNDVWRSADNGATWTRVTANAGWSPRYGHSMIVMEDGSIILTGGVSFGSGYLNDVWRSQDGGSTWTRINANAGWVHRFFHSTIAMPDGSILLTGGGYNPNDNGKEMNDTWRSTDDGATWTEISSRAGWIGREGQGSVLMRDGSIVLMGGRDVSLNYKNDVWRMAPIGSSRIIPQDTTGGTSGYSGKFVISPNSTIFLSKTITPQVMKQGTDAYVTITLTNAGPSSIHDIELLDESLPEFPVTNGETRSITAQMLMPNETRILRYTVTAAKPGKYTFNGTSVMFAGDDGNYHLIRSNAPTVTVLEPLIPSPDQPFDIGRAISGFFGKIFP